MNSENTNIEIEYYIFSKNENHINEFSSLLKKNDIIFAFGARRKTMSWMPFADKLPQRLASNFNEYNFIIGYPGIPYDKSNVYANETSVK